MRGFADTEDGQIHYRRATGDGLPIMLLHRTPASSASFEAVLRRIEGHRPAFALDTPGFGQSFRPPGSPATIDYARWFLAAADALGIDGFHLCAHHTGTHFAVEMAALAPQRIRSLMLSGVMLLSAEERAGRRAAIGKARIIDDDGDYLGACWQLMKTLFPDYDPDLVHSETLGALDSIPGRDQAFDAIYAQDFGAALRAVRCPLRVVQAVDDPLTQRGMLDRLGLEHPSIPIELIGPAGLAAPERQPEQFTEALLAFVASSET
ncbi:MAG: alpha/beta hydrolase [Sphingomonadaceae bacterium]|nr:alpha/beta hydrolase [Sphingomonadaceae bacterium]